jgi:hypothetical protein
VPSPASAFAFAIAAATSSTKWYDASGCHPSGFGRCDTTTTCSPVGGLPSQPFVMSNRCLPMTIAPMAAHVGRT